MSAAAQRDGAIQAAKTDFPTAHRRAHEVSEAWFQAQALGWVARFAPEAEVERIAGEALKAASGGKDAYQQVASSAWAIRALAERGRAAEAALATTKLISLSVQISHPVSRLTALSLLWQAAWPLQLSVRKQVLQALVAACHSAQSWKAGRALHDVALMLAVEQPAEARRIVEQMSDGRYKRQAQRRLERGETAMPRPFFW